MAAGQTEEQTVRVYGFEVGDKVPTANFFQRSGYKDNPVAQRNNVVGKLIAATAARVDEEVRKPGARELAAALR